jgi:hypothetical protein
MSSRTTKPDIEQARIEGSQFILLVRRCKLELRDVSEFEYIRSVPYFENQKCMESFFRNTYGENPLPKNSVWHQDVIHAIVHFLEPEQRWCTPKKANRVVYTDERTPGKSLIPDSVNAEGTELLEFKFQAVSGTAYDKLAGVPFKYADIMRANNINKLRIIISGTNEYEASKDGLISEVTYESYRKEFAQLFTKYGVSYERFTDLLERACDKMQKLLDDTSETNELIDVLNKWDLDEHTPKST